MVFALLVNFLYLVVQNRPSVFVKFLTVACSLKSLVDNVFLNYKNLKRFVDENSSLIFK